MESDVGREQISHYGCWAGMVTLRRTENPENKVRFFEHPHNAPLVEFGRHAGFRLQYEVIVV